MAPSRRKGGGRVSAAAAAAAACRKWKVGDLVLAKVKGFPAWPATVSAPEKWGYSGGWKKVLVHFFGTQQIAFCNPADVEEFTEEKKETLLVRRHGKGADYVRAVHEIIESYEESKKQEQVVDINYLDEGTVSTAGNRESDFSSNDQIEAPSATRSSRVKKSKSTGEKNESSLPVADAADATRADTGDMDTSSEEPTDSSLVMRKPRASILSSQKKGGDVQPQISSSLKRDSSACRSRSSSRVYTSRFQKSSLPLSNGNKSVEDTAAKVSQNGLVRRSKRIRKSPDVSEGHATGSPAFLSNGSNEENGSEIVMVDSDTFSVTEGSTVETGSKSLQPESIAECGEKDVELSQALDFQTKAIVLKKKRKPNRKRVTNDAPESIGGLNKAGADIELHKAGQVSPISHENSHEKYSKEDGDEHLPLVKRARVRMGRPSSVGEELDTGIQSEAKLLEASNSFSSGVSTQSQDHGPEKNSFVVNEVTENPSLPNKGPQSSSQSPQLWDVKKKQQFGCSVDGEAALPPSKRLHRALEAMSANAAEDGRIEEPSSSTKLLTNGCCLSSIPDSPHISSESRLSNELGVQNVDSLRNNASQGGTCGISDICAPAEPKEIVKSSIEGTIFNGPVRSSSSPEHELCKDIHVDAGDHFDSKGITLSSSGTQNCEAVVVAQSSKPLSPDPAEEQTCLGCNQDSLAQMLPVKDECKNENHASEFRNHNSAKPLDELGPSDHSGMSSDPVSTSVDHKCSPQNGTNLLLCSAKGNCSGSTQLWKLSLHADDQVDGMCEVVKEIKPAQRESNAVLTPTSLKVMDVVAEGPPNLGHINSVSDDHLGDKDVSGIRPFSTPTDGVDSLALVSPPNTSICNTSTSDNDNILENNGCCSPDVHLHHAKSKNMGKWSSKAEAAAILASFQAVIGTLKRTKESIGRATRIAIDCAKFGIAAKVVEILVRDLQSESSLRRRVDLFFLVDSITQCSRGLRGDVGGIYPSAIQAVLQRLLLAAAPPGSDAQENRRQCLKVLKLWLERRILPDSIVRHHIRALESLSGSSSSGAYSRRPLRTERAFDDPIRQMEGMLVDEYGSNSSFQLPGFHMPPMLKDEGDESDSDGGSFEAVTPEHDSKTPEEGEGIPIPAAVGNHRHILEDVDGELEMEDVAPACEALSTSTSNACINTSQLIHPQLEQHFPPTPTFAPHVPKDVAPSFPPLPTSPPPAAPPPPPPPTLPPMPPMPASISESDAKLYNVRENLHQFVAQQPVVPGVNSMNSDAALYQAPEYRDVNMPTQIPDFSSNTGCHQPVVPGNGVQQTDGAAFYNKAYHLPPPQPAPSNQFSYVQADQQVQSLPPPPPPPPPPLPLPPPPPYPNRAHFVQSTDGGSFSSDHDRMELAPHEHRESWRFPGPSFSSTHYPDPARGSYHLASFGGPPSEPPLPNHSWGFPPQSMNHGEFMAHGPQSRGPIPVATRAPSFWQPR